MKTPNPTDTLTEGRTLRGLGALELARDQQEAGSWFELVDPVSSEETGIRLLIVGPDSERQRNARRAMEAEILKAQQTRRKLQPQRVDELIVGALLACILDWEVTEAGEPLPFAPANVERLLRAGAWVRDQIDTFAGSREPYFGKA